MTTSMTAFSRVQFQCETATLCWEIRSINHRYQEVSFRIPEQFRQLEPQLRNLLRDQCSRGKFECQLKVTYENDQDSFQINENLVDRILTLGSEIAASRHIANDLTLSSVLNIPGVVQTGQPELEGLMEQVKVLFQKGITELCSARKTEGQALQKLIMSRVQSMQEEINKANSSAAMALEDAKDKLMTRLQTLQLDVDHGRVEQEIALMLTRLDVSEELDRLKTHLLEVGRILSNTENTGRRLDFLMQELNREANTLGSKSDSIVLTNCAIEMKVLIEQMREQIQNIE